MKQTTTKPEKKRTRRPFAESFAELTLFIEEHQRLPVKPEHPRLVAWMGMVIKMYRAKKLKPEYITQLNTIGFTWNLSELKWQSKAAWYKSILVNEKRIPASRADGTLYHWLKQNKVHLQNKTLSKKEQKIIQELLRLTEEIQAEAARQRLIPALQKKWLKKYAGLVAFRETHPGQWPACRSRDITEKKIAHWCMAMRVRYRKKILDEAWIKRLQQIGFPFNWLDDTWIERFTELKQYIRTHKRFPYRDDRLYTWVRNQYRRYDRLSKKQQKQLDAVHTYRKQQKSRKR